MSHPRIGLSPVEFPVPCGIMLRGHHWPHGADVALLLHEPGRDLDAWGTLPDRLVGDGLSVYAIDLPGHGLSDDPWQPAGLGPAIAVLVETIAGINEGRIIIIAAGLTATIALRQPALPVIAGIVALSPPAVDDETATSERWPSRPKLILVGSTDTEALAAARQAAKRAPGWSLLSTFPTATRGTRLLTTAWGGQVQEQIQGFVRACRLGRAPG